jgi:magnesium transporter
MQRRHDLSPTLQWIDVTNPSIPEIEHLAAEFDLHPTSVQDCLDPEHLPKYELINDRQFIILRAFDENSTADSDTIQELTRKVAIFMTSKYVLTIHRSEMAFLSDLNVTECKQRHKEITTELFVSELLMRTIGTYEKPIDKALDQLDQLELAVFGTSEHQQMHRFELKTCYLIRRQASVYKRILRLSLDVLARLQYDSKAINPYFHNTREVGEGAFFYADELLEGVNNLLNLHISLSSQKTNEASHETNEVIRFLTIFSVFILPMNVITGIYGMNFEMMPELKHPFGYPMVIGLMFFVCVAIYFFFKKKGWMK